MSPCVTLVRLNEIKISACSVFMRCTQGGLLPAHQSRWNQGSREKTVPEKKNLQPVESTWPPSAYWDLAGPETMTMRVTIDSHSTDRKLRKMGLGQVHSSHTPFCTGLTVCSSNQIAASHWRQQSQERDSSSDQDIYLLSQHSRFLPASWNL